MLGRSFRRSGGPLFILNSEQTFYVKNNVFPHLDFSLLFLFTTKISSQDSIYLEKTLDSEAIIPAMEQRRRRNFLSGEMVYVI